MSQNLTYLITGANRGIGKGLTSSLLQRPNTTVIAGVRDIAKSTSILEGLPKANGSKLILVKLDSQSETDPSNAVSELASKHSITSLDAVIANAGIGHSGSTIAKNSAEALRDHFNTNTIGPILLFQAVAPLLKASPTGHPKFLAISTIIGSIGAQEQLAALPPTLSPYGASKAALNWVFKRIHIEENWLTAYVSHPGLVLTDMTLALTGSENSAKQIGAITVDQSVAGLLKTLDGASREKNGGVFMNYDGSVLPW
jgi:norsolorinic acid ketoreductase